MVFWCFKLMSLFRCSVMSRNDKLREISDRNLEIGRFGAKLGVSGIIRES